MAKRRRGRSSACPSYGEPWTAKKSVLHGEKPEISDPLSEIEQSISDNWQKRDDNAPWVIWAKGLGIPGKSSGLVNGNLVEFDDSRILTTFYRLTGLPEGLLSHEAYARRVVACVNAMSGIDDPERFASEAKIAMVSLTQKAGSQ